MIKPYQVLATDYDGTLAHHGTVSAETLAAIRPAARGWKEVGLGDGSRVGGVKGVFPDIDLCDLVVAENGALLYWPNTGKSAFYPSLLPKSL